MDSGQSPNDWAREALRAAIVAKVLRQLHNPEEFANEQNAELMVAARNRQLLQVIFETLATMVKLLDLEMDDDLQMFLINDPTLNRLTPLLQEMVLPGGFNELGNNG